MESGRFLLAVILMIAVVILTNILLPPVRRPPPATVDVDTAAQTTPAQPPAVPAPALGAVTPPAPTPATAHADTVRVESPLYRFGISTLGGALVSEELLRYESFAPGLEGQPVQLEPPAGPGLIRHRLRIGERTVELSGATFTVSPAAGLRLAEGQQPTPLRLTWSDPATGVGMVLTYTFRPDSYVVDVTAQVVGTTTTPQLLIDAGPALRSNEAVPTEDQRAAAYVINNPQTGIQSVSLARFHASRVDNGPLNWWALKNKYFLVAAMQADSSPMPFGGLIADTTGLPGTAHLTATLLADQSGRLAYRIYVGPQEFDRMAALNNQLQDVSVFGWRFLQPVLRPLGHAITWALLQMHRALGLSYGWVLILFGFLIRFVLWPLNAKAMRSQLKNMELQPRIKDIQTRYKQDPQRLQQEMLKLYKEEGFNPAGGCLPMLLPLPVLITLFFVFQSTIEFRGVPFLWLPDLARKDPFYILPVALGLSMFVQQWLNMRTTKDAPAQMKYMTYFMPAFLTFLFLNFASGLNLYYASMNIASVPQQLQIMKERQRRMGTPKPKS